MSAPILIMGATSGVGAKAVEEALSRGFSVRAFARGADKLEPAPNLEPFAGDALKAGDVAQALEGAQAVIYALGIRERLSMLWEEETLFSETTKVLLSEMKTAGVTRLIAVTGFGAGRSQQSMSRIERMGHRAILGKVYEDKDIQEEKIMNSDLDWTIVRPVIMTNGAKGTFRVLRSQKLWRNGLVSRADVAKYMIDAIERGLDRQEDVVLAR